MRWRAVHVGFEDDGLKIRGAEIWQQTWRPTGDASIELRHPAHRHQIHRFDIYEVGDANKPIRFAAGELSNGVWGFYVPSFIWSLFAG